jgi:hypothetical protein
VLLLAADGLSAFVWARCSCLRVQRLVDCLGWPCGIQRNRPCGNHRNRPFIAVLLVAPPLGPEQAH